MTKTPHPAGITCWCKAYYNQYQAIASHLPSVSMLNPWWITKTLANIWEWLWFHTHFSCYCCCLATQNTPTDSENVRTDYENIREITAPSLGSLSKKLEQDWHLHSHTLSFLIILLLVIKLHFKWRGTADQGHQ